MTLFRCQVLYIQPAKGLLIGDTIFTTLKVERDFSRDRQIHTQTQKSSRAYGLMSFSEKTRKFNHLQMLEQRQHLECWSGWEWNLSFPHGRLAPNQLG